MLSCAVKDARKQKQSAWNKILTRYIPRLDPKQRFVGLKNGESYKIRNISRLSAYLSYILVKEVTSRTYSIA